MQQHQRGFAQVATVFLLLLGVIASVFLMQNRQIFRSFAGNPAVVIKSANNQALPLGNDSIPDTTSSKVRVEITSPLGVPGTKEEVAKRLTLAGFEDAYGAKKGDANFNPIYDLNKNNIINIVDFSLLVVKVKGNPAAFFAPKVVTTSYRLAEDITGLNQAEFLPYTTAPTVINYEFKNKTIGRKFVWVDFKDSNDKTERFSAPADLVSIPTPTPTPTVASGCAGSISFSCTTSGPRLSVNWNITNKFGGNSCNVFIKDSRGDHQINGTNYAGSCSGSWSDASLAGRAVTNSERYQLFVSNGNLGGGCFNEPKGESVVSCSVIQPITAGFEVGLEAGEQRDTSRVNLVSESGAKWVRLNFVGTDWNSGSSDVNTYNSIINAYVSKGIQIIGLVGIQSVSGGYDRTRPENFTQKFTDTTDAIVSRFGDRVKVYELFNEPNDWAGGTSAVVSERYFAEYLASIYRKIKIDRKRSDIYLNSGPLFSFDSNNGSQYLQNTYDEGKRLSGAYDWDTIKTETGSYPLDGVGYHIYVAQGMNDQGQVLSKLQGNLDSIKGVITSKDPGKKIWITEFGWGTGQGRLSEEVQAADLEKAYGVFKNYSLVRMAMWFTLLDFDRDQWGLVKSDGTKKAAWITFQKINGVK